MQHLPELTRFVSRSFPASLAGKKVLDLGCGKGWWGAFVRQHDGGTHANLVGIDVYEPYVSYTRNTGLYNAVMRQDLTDPSVLATIGDYDIVLAIEVIEHLERSRAAAVLRALSLVVGTVIISLPNGDQRRGPVNGVDSEAHLSVWAPRDLRAYGFTVHGLGLKGTDVATRLGVGLLYLATPFTYNLPLFAHTLVGVRHTDILVEHRASAGS